MGPLSPHIAGHIALYGSRLLNGQVKSTWRSNGRFKCEFGYLENSHEYHSSMSAVHLGKDYDTNLSFVKNYLWKTAFQGNVSITRRPKTVGKALGEREVHVG